MPRFHLDNKKETFKANINICFKSLAISSRCELPLGNCIDACYYSHAAFAACDL